MHEKIKWMHSFKPICFVDPNYPSTHLSTHCPCIDPLSTHIKFTMYAYTRIRTQI